MSLIDVHTHLVPSSFPDNPSPSSNARWPCMHLHGDRQGTIKIADTAFRELDSRSWDGARRIEDMDRDGVQMQALSPMPELLSYWFDVHSGLEMARWMNARIAELVARAPKRFAGLGMVPLQDVACAAAELTRLRADGFSGVEIGSNINGVVLGDRRFDEFWSEAERLGLAVFVHALHPIGNDRLQQGFQDLVPFAAFPLDTALSALTLIRAGVPQRFPKLRLGFSHGGGAIVPLVHRLGQGWKLSNGFNGALPESPVHYARQMFYDSLVYERDYLKHLATVFAPGQVFGGTDYPYAIMETNLASALASVLERAHEGASASAHESAPASAHERAPEQSDAALQASLTSGAARRFLGLAS